jgi:hypothetical protein
MQIDTNWSIKSCKYLSNMLGFFLGAASTSSTGHDPKHCSRSCDAGSSIDGGDDAYDPCFLFFKQSLCLRWSI